jgi:hypothetical protein
VIGAEVVARKTHTTEIAFFRINTVSFNFDKNTHGAQVNALVGVSAMPGPVTQIRINIHLKSYRYCGPNLHGDHTLSVLNGFSMIMHPVFF